MLSFPAGATFADFIDRRSAQDQDNVFVRLIRRDGRREELTFGELARLSELVVTALVRSGAAPGDRILILTPNCLEMIIALLAAARSSLVSVPVNPASAAGEVDHVIRLVEPTVVFAGPDQLRLLEQAGLLPAAVRLVVVVGGEAPGLAAAQPVLTWEELLVEGEHGSSARAVRPRSADLFQLLMTSGTTGRPKAVMHSHTTRLRSAYRVAFHARLRDDDTVLNPFPAFHINCLDSALFPALLTGCHAVIFESFSASGFWPAVRDEHATVVAVLPTVVRAICATDAAETDRDHDVRLVLGALRPTRRELDSFLERFHIQRYETGYGLTEAGMAVTQTLSDLDRHYPSIGIPMFDRTVDIVDDSGEPTPTGTSGEIVVSGTPPGNVMDGYWRDPEATARVLHDGWLHTGDLAVRDEAGFFYFVGRSKDVIKRSGENIGAEEVEAVLTEHPDIQEAAVIGIPDAYRDEAVMAFVVAARPGVQLGVSAVREFCVGRIADFKVPSVISVVPALPRGVLGKVDKNALRAVAAASPRQESGGNRHAQAR